MSLIHDYCRLQAVQAAHQVEVLQFESEMNAYRKQLEESNETVRMLREEVRISLWIITICVDLG